MANDIHPIIQQLHQHSTALQDLSDLLTAGGGIDTGCRRAVLLLDILARDHARIVEDLKANLPVTEAL